MTKPKRISNSFSCEEVAFLAALLTATKNEEQAIHRFARRPECARIYRKVMAMKTRLGLRGTDAEKKTRTA